jgi:hypothetical protein
MIKKQAKIVLFIVSVITLGVYVYLKNTESLRFAEQAYKIFINVQKTGLEANKKQLEDIITYADKLEEKGDLESIRLCFGLRDAVMITLFTEKQKATKIHFGYSLATNNPVSTNFNKDVFLELCEMNRFNETELIKRIPIENNSIISNLFATNISVSDILSCTNFLYKDSIRLSYSTILEYDLYEHLSDLDQKPCMLSLNPIMKTSDEQFVQTICMIQNFRDLYIHAEVYKKYGFLWNSKQIKKNIAEIIQKRGIVKRVDTWNLESSLSIYYMLGWYDDESKFQGRVLLCLEPCMNDLSFLPEEYRKFFEKQRRLREEQKAND